MTSAAYTRWRATHHPTNMVGRHLTRGGRQDIVQQTSGGQDIVQQTSVTSSNKHTCAGNTMHSYTLAMATVATLIGGQDQFLAEVWQRTRPTQHMTTARDHMYSTQGT